MHAEVEHRPKAIPMIATEDGGKLPNQLVGGRQTASFTPSPDLFYRLFPMHLVLDQDCRLVQVRGGLRGVEALRVGCE